MKTSQFLKSLMMAAALAAAATQAQAADVARWSDLRQLEQKFKTAGDDQKRGEIIDKAAALIAKLAPNQKQKLDGVQIRELVELLRVTAAADIGNVILEQNIVLIQSNAKAIRAEVKKLSPKEAALVDDSIDTVLGGSVTSDPLLEKDSKALPRK